MEEVADAEFHSIVMTLWYKINCNFHPVHLESRLTILMVGLWAEDDDLTLGEQSGHDQINSLHPPPIQESHSDMKPRHWGRRAKILEEIQPPRTCLFIPCNVGFVSMLYILLSIPAVPSRDVKNHSQVGWIFQYWTKLQHFWWIHQRENTIRYLQRGGKVWVGMAGGGKAWSDGWQLILVLRQGAASGDGKDPTVCTV